MTGAPLPAGADAVVPVERTDGGVDRVSITAPAAVGAYVRRAGEDVAAGAVVQRAGDVVTERSVAVLASVGRAQVHVVRRPHVVVISTGDELVEVGHPLEPGQIVDSNGIMLVALARSAGASAWRTPHSHDVDEEFRAVLDAALREADVVVTSGGVSMGAYDTVKAVLSQSGEVDFVKVAQHPGMPQGVGRARRAADPDRDAAGKPGELVRLLRALRAPARTPPARPPRAHPADRAGDAARAGRLPGGQAAVRPRRPRGLGPTASAGCARSAARGRTSSAASRWPTPSSSCRRT